MPGSYRGPPSHKLEPRRHDLVDAAVVNKLRVNVWTVPRDKKETERSGPCGEVAVSGVSTVVQLFQRKELPYRSFQYDVEMEVFFVAQRCALFACALAATIACTSQQNR